jgi:cytochrome c556
MTRQALASAVVVSVAFGIGSLAGSGTGTDAIKARQHAMEQVQDAMKALGAIAKKETPFEAAGVKKNAGIIADRLKAVATLFPAGSDKGDVETWALADIWSDAEGFEERRQEAHAAAVALQSVNEEAAFRPALGKLGQACQSCHEMYRRPKD